MLFEERGGRLNLRNVSVFVIALFFLLFLIDNASAGVDEDNHFSNISIRDFSPENNSIVGGTIRLNFSVSTGTYDATQTFWNVTNVTFYIVNSSGALIALGSNHTANLTYYELKVSTSSLDVIDGPFNFTFEINTSAHIDNTIQSANFSNGTSAPGNITLDNTVPTITLNATSVNTGGPNGNTSSTGLVNFNFTVAEPHLFDCLFTDGGVTKRMNLTDGLANRSRVAANNFTLNTAAGVHEYTVTCSDKAIDSNFARPNTIVSSTGKIIIDDETPFTDPIEFRDTENEKQTEFEFGDTVLLDCNPKDNITAVQPSLIAITVKNPEGNERNLTGISKEFDSLGEVKFTETDVLGDYLIFCHLFDYLDNSNKTNSTFSVKSKFRGGNNPFAAPGFQAPVGKVKVSSGVTSNAGILTESGLSRLLEKGSAIIITVNNEEHKVTVLTASDESVSLEFQSEPVEVMVNKGESKGVDLDSDGTNDVEVTFHKMFPRGGRFADLTFKSVATPAQEKQEGSTEREGQEGAEGGAAGISGSKAPLVVTVIVIIVIVIIGFTLIRGKKK